MTVITGRRRVGKTSLSIEATKEDTVLYLFISKKSETLLCEDFKALIIEKFDYPIIGEIKIFRDIFKVLLEIAKKVKYVLIIDEFQEFIKINPSVYSEIQNLWDQYKRDIKLHVIFIGSIYSLMTKIFQNNKEPLFGRSDRTIYLKPLKASVLKNILSDRGKYKAENLFHNYLITGGVPRYQEILEENNVFTINEIIDFMLGKNSPFLNEGKNLLIEEFGKEYGTYFSILELLSMGRTSRSEIESILEINSGGYLDRLEKDYDIISKRRPFNAKQTGKIQKYYIKDNFLNFWFRFIYKNRSAVETGNFEFIKKIIKTELSTYSRLFLEKLFYQLLAETNKYNQIGTYWERGNKNEIDIIAISDVDNTLLIGDVKLNPKKIRINELKQKAISIQNKYNEYRIEYRGFSIDDIDKYIQAGTQPYH